MDHPDDHQDAIASEKLQLLKISYSKAEQKQAVVGVLSTDAWLSGSVVEVLTDFGFRWTFSIYASGAPNEQISKKSFEGYF